MPRWVSRALRWTARICTRATSNGASCCGAAGNQHGYDCGDGNGLCAQRLSRVAVSFIGEGGASLGEWHEAINLCAARRLPAVFCIENNQTALSTSLAEQSAVRVFADKAVGYGIPA